MDRDRHPPEPVAPLDPARFVTRALAGRSHQTDVAHFARPVDPTASLEDFLGSLPDVLGSRALRSLAGAIARAQARSRPVLWGLGGHVVKVGLSPLLIDLLERRFVSGFVLNGAAAIHDVEIALVGSTSEDVAAGLFDGTYGSADETGALFAAAAQRAADEVIGLGTALGAQLHEVRAPQAKLSLIATAYAARIPVTVHVSVGADTVHMHPALSGAALGASTLRDFHRLAALVSTLDEGVYVNVGSAVVLPEVFLKAVAMAHNAETMGTSARPRIRITTGNLDMLRHYRPRVNVLDRPAVAGYDLAGHHEILVPLLRAAILLIARGLQPGS